MTLIKWKNNPNAVDRFPFMPSTFNDFFSDFMNGDLLQKDYFKSIPAVNIMERKDDFTIQLAAPGVKKSDFKVEVDKGVLTISMEKTDEKNDENEKFTRKEFSFSSFKRTFSLPDHVNTESIAAEYKDGILMLTIPKKEEAKAKPVREIVVS